MRSELLPEVSNRTLYRCATQRTWTLGAGAKHLTLTSKACVSLLPGTEAIDVPDLSEACDLSSQYVLATLGSYI